MITLIWYGTHNDSMNLTFQVEFESLFRKYDETASFLYLRSFRRARVNFSTPEMAATARIHLHELELYGKRVKCYFAQVCYHKEIQQLSLYTMWISHICNYFHQFTMYIYIYIFFNVKCFDFLKKLINFYWSLKIHV